MRVTGRVVADNADTLVRRVAVAVDRSVVLGTPVDTGRARSNWIAEINNPADGINEDADRGGARQLAANERMIATYNGDRDQSVHITNNLPYIGRLNDGWSAQAPAGFVEEAVHIAVDTIKGAKITVEGGVK